MNPPRTTAERIAAARKSIKASVATIRHFHHPVDWERIASALEDAIAEADFANHTRRARSVTRARQALALFDRPAEGTYPEDWP